MIDEDGPTMSAGSGAIQGIGVGPKGEPGISPKAMSKYKRKNQQQGDRYNDSQTALCSLLIFELTSPGQGVSRRERDLLAHLALCLAPQLRDVLDRLRELALQLLDEIGRAHV